MTTDFLKGFSYTKMRVCRVYRTPPHLWDPFFFQCGHGLSDVVPCVVLFVSDSPVQTGPKLRPQRSYTQYDKGWSTQVCRTDVRSDSRGGGRGTPTGRGTVPRLKV